MILRNSNLRAEPVDHNVALIRHEITWNAKDFNVEKLSLPSKQT